MGRRMVLQIQMSSVRSARRRVILLSIAQRNKHNRVARRIPSLPVHTKSNPKMVRLKLRASMEHSAHGVIGATDGLMETKDMPLLNIKQEKNYRMLLVVAILVEHKLETWLQDLKAT